MSRHPGTAPTVVPPRVLLDPGRGHRPAARHPGTGPAGGCRGAGPGRGVGAAAPVPAGRGAGAVERGPVVRRTGRPAGRSRCAGWWRSSPQQRWRRPWGSPSTRVVSCWPTLWSWPTGCRGSTTWSTPAWSRRTSPARSPATPTTCRFEAVRHADRLVCAVPDKIGQVRARRLIDEARLWHDPDRAVEDERQALESRHVTMGRTGCPATREVHLLLDQVDAEAFDHTVTELASRLSDLGDPDPLDLRRARAVGILADPQRALDLLHGPVDQQTRRAIQDGRAAQVRPGGVAEIFVHVTPDDLAEHIEAGTGSAVVERLGAVSLELLEAWFAGRRVMLRPVLDLTSPDTVAALDPHDRDHCHAGARHPARRDLRLPRMSSRLPDLRPRPHRTLGATRRGWPAGPDPSGQPCSALPDPSSDQDLHRLGLRAPTRRHACLDQPDRPQLRRAGGTPPRLGLTSVLVGRCRRRTRRVRARSWRPGPGPSTSGSLARRRHRARRGAAPTGSTRRTPALRRPARARPRRVRRARSPIGSRRPG